MRFSLERMIGVVLRLPWDVTSGVEVLRGVCDGLGIDVGGGVQVGSMRLRGVALTLIGIGKAGVLVTVADGAAQPASKMLIPNSMTKPRFTTYLPFVCGLTLQTSRADQPMGV
jgi:hypothetical protein